MTGPENWKAAKGNVKIESSEQKEGQQEKPEKPEEAPKPKTPEEINAELKRIDGKIAIERVMLNKARAIEGLPSTDISLAIENLQKQRQQLIGEEPKQSLARDEIKFSQMSATFFREMEMLARNVNNLDGAEKYARAGTDFMKFRNSATFKESTLKDPSQLSDTLAVLTSELQQGIEYHSSDRKNISHELKPAFDEEYRQARKIFVEVGKQVFPDVTSRAHASIEVLLRDTQGRISQITDPSLDMWVRSFRERFDISDAVRMRDSNPAELLQKIELQINDAGIHIKNASINNSPETKKDIAEISRAVFALELVRQDIETRLQSKPVQERQKAQADSITFNEAAKRLKTATTIEQVRAAVTPEIVEVAKIHILAEIDDSIEQAERTVTKEPSMGILNKKSTANVFFGINGNEGVVFQKIGAAKFGRVMSMKEMAVMPIVDFMKSFFDYDLEKDTARAEKLKKYTNAFM